MSFLTKHKKIFIHRIYIGIVFVAILGLIAQPYVSLAEEETPEPQQETIQEVVVPEPEPEPEPTVVETGDAQAITVVDNEVNETDVTEELGTDEGDESDQDTEDEVIEEENTEETPEEEHEPVDIDLKVDVENEAGVDNDLGTEGVSGDNEVGETEGDTEIETGDIGILTHVENDVNETEVKLEGECLDCVVGNTDTISSTDEFANDTEVNIDVENEADVETDIESEATSGDNTSNDGGGDVTIDTGNIAVFTDLASFINSTFVGGNFDVLNIYDTPAALMDHSGFDEEPTEVVESGESTGAGGSNETEVDVDNEADVKNDVKVKVNSGGNSVVGATGKVTLETGDIYVQTSILNTVNTTAIGRNWKFKVINIYSDWAGDLILPTLYNRGNASVSCGCMDELSISTSNSANVSNNVSVNATSGDNTIDGGGGASIDTGDIFANTNIYNLINTNIIGSDWFFTKLTVSGAWHGRAFNLPNSTQALDDGNGLTVFDDGPGNSENSNVQKKGTGHNSLDVDIENEASVENNVTVDANSGGNAVERSGDATIETGDIYANTSVTNLVNSNFVGDDWEFYLVNVFGSWDGDLHFGMPDLAISEFALPAADTLGPDDEITYMFAFTNGGDAPADDVIISDYFDMDAFEILDKNGGIVDGNHINWNVGTINPGESRILSYGGRATRYGSYSHNAHVSSEFVTNTVMIAGSNGDRNSENNVSGGGVRLAANYQAPVYGEGWEPDPDIRVKKSAARNLIYAGDTLEYTIDLTNHSVGKGFEVGIFDELYDQYDNLLERHAWDLGEVYGKEEITVEYEVYYPTTTPSGDYTNRVTVYSLNEQNVEMEFVSDEHTVRVIDYHLSPAVLLSATGESLLESLLPVGGPDEETGEESSDLESAGNMSEIIDDVAGALGIISSHSDDGDSGPTVLGVSYNGNARLAFTVQRIVRNQLPIYESQTVSYSSEIQNILKMAFLLSLLLGVLYIVQPREVPLRPIRRKLQV